MTPVNSSKLVSLPDVTVFMTPHVYRDWPIEAKHSCKTGVALLHLHSIVFVVVSIHRQIQFGDFHHHTTPHVYDIQTQHFLCHNKDNLPCHGGLTSSHRCTFIVASPVCISGLEQLISPISSTTSSFMSWTTLQDVQLSSS